MFRIKGQVQTSHLSNLWAYRSKSHFRDKGQSNTFILPNTKPNRFTYHVCNKGRQGTSSNFSFIKLRDKGHFNTFILPNLKPNRFTYHVSHQGTSSNFPFTKVVGKYTTITFSRQGWSIQYFHFTKYKTKYVHISCLQQGIQETSSNLPFIKLRDMGHSNTFILPNMKLNRFTYHVSHQRTSRKMVNLHIYQTCNHIS